VTTDATPNVRRSYMRVLIVWIGVLVALYALQEMF
jgi:hypothetical protein